MGVIFGGTLPEPTKPSPFCGKMTDHEPHEWTSKAAHSRGTTYRCPGPPVTEGGRGPIPTRVRLPNGPAE